MFSKSFSVAVTVSDGKKAAKWYKEKRGFNVSTDYGEWVTAWPQSAPWKLHLCAGKLDLSSTGIASYSADVKKTVDQLKKKGVKFTQDYSKTEESETAMFEDPDGNVFWISAGAP
jgi:predicted enzyme related to lactoylglutathione lyase